MQPSDDATADLHSTPRRLLVVGVDGGTFRVIDRLQAGGLLPTFGRMRRDGAERVLRSTNPPVSPVAWTSFATAHPPRPSSS